MPTCSLDCLGFRFEHRIGLVGVEGSLPPRGLVGSDGVAFGYLRGHVGGKVGTADAVRKQAPPATVTSSTNTTGRRTGPIIADQNQLRPIWATG